MSRRQEQTIHAAAVRRVLEKVASLAEALEDLRDADEARLRTTNRGRIAMITENDIRRAVTYVVDTQEVNRWVVGVEYRETVHYADSPWTVRIAYRRKHSRKDIINTLEGYGKTPLEAAEDAAETYRRAVERGDVATE